MLWPACDERWRNNGIADPRNPALDATAILRWFRVRVACDNPGGRTCAAEQKAAGTRWARPALRRSAPPDYFAP